MNILGFVTDEYEREARLAPALFILLPAIFVAGILVPSLRVDSAWIVGSLALCGGLAVLRTVIRDRGKAIEKRLWSEWGGMPSVARLRHRDEIFPAEETAAFHAIATRKMGDLTMPTVAEEAADPEAADRVYARVSNWVLDNTRNKEKYALVVKHNIGYGFRRNMLGGKPIALAIDLVIIATCAVWMAISVGLFRREFSVDAIIWQQIAVLGVALVHFLLLAIIIKNSWVRAAADAFSVQLIRSLNTFT